MGLLGQQGQSRRGAGVTRGPTVGTPCVSWFPAQTLMVQICLLLGGWGGGRTEGRLPGGCSQGPGGRCEGGRWGVGASWRQHADFSRVLKG